jgi:hypothetical protein
MQDGSVTVERRKRGPAVWCFRWREAGPDGRRIHRRIALGTADELRSIASAHKMVVGLRHEINANDIRTRRESITVADLSKHYRQRELADRNLRISYSAKRAYAGYLEKWIDPRWGEYKLMDVRAVEVESWLKSLNLAPGTRCKLRNVMSLLFNHGRRHELCDCNPIQWVRQTLLATVLVPTDIVGYGITLYATQVLEQIELRQRQTQITQFEQQLDRVGKGVVRRVENVSDAKVTTAMALDLARKQHRAL